VFGLADKTAPRANGSRSGTWPRSPAIPRCRRASATRNLGPKALYDLFIALCKQDFPVEARNFVRVLIANDRLALLPEICAQFAELKNEREACSRPKIHTAFPL